MKNQQRILASADIAEIVHAPPPGHQHLRATSRLHSGEEIVLQEATEANWCEPTWGSRPIRKGRAAA